ncbi:uncharacterized protein LOC130015007 [Mercurialis annua]|uniref:uncharacterized protein LOC126660006 n=1 Tax=Mercurialis annua TaxID=3986 RepID=UPI00216101B5|nr:uncharacterized protein LOC126660006 [Mercurialis annua]XP_055960322.1 uncharacterized protein LOC130015007 [Mercurialis annua]
MDFPFELTDEEMEIIRFSRSSFILARSGTGKTTVLIMKLFQKEQLHHLASEGFHEVERNSNKETDGYTLRQMFVTVNARLCYSVRQYISQLKRSTCKGTYSGENSNFMEEDFDEMLESSDIPSSFADLSQSSYPLVITFNKFLMMLDGTIGSSFFERFPELRRLRRDKRTACESMVLKTFIRSKEVNYEKFCSSYWPYFSPMNTKKLVPSSVFSEIISHIKGGSRIGINDDRISREDYIIYSERRLSFFSEEERGRIYDIFLEYEKKKKRNGEFDMSDLVADLHKRFRDETFEGEKIDFVYIDEVQDLTMRQISLFKYICRNFKEGFVFSGDTAQTIVRGVDFRFEDIRALFYREFLCERKEKGKIADLFYLSQNFRTHASVLKLANSVLDLLYHFFPSSVDKLKPETSIVHGEQPVWVQTEDGLNGLRASFKSSGSVYKGFGAEQVILVRDEDNKNEVFNLVGKQALVLTVMECKGLEFQDVLLYNLFSSSPLNDEWDIVYGYMKGKGFLEFPHHLKSVPSFDEGKHIAMCSELKQLYVAITRTRRRLWILENGQCPVLRYWEKLQLVHIRGLDGGFLEEIQVASSQEEWKARGFKFFYQKNYDKARFCFERAGESYWEKWAKAACLRHSADLLLHSDPIRAHKHLTQAAKMYQSIGKIESAAQCFFELKEYEKAGKLYLENFGDSKLEEAGECFHLAACYERAADIYAKCNLYSKCLSVCADGKLFHLGYQYIENWKCSSFHLDTEVCQRFFEKGAVYLKKIKDSKSMMKFVKAFESEEVMRTFLMSKECLDELVSLEKEWGNFSEAANVANMKGDVLLEVDLLLMAKLYERACKLILVYVLYNSVWAQQSNGWPLNKFVLKDELLTKAKTFSKKVSNGFYDFVCTEANILSHEVYLFQINKYWDDSWKNGSIRGKMLCVRKFLDTYLSPSMSKQILEDDMIKFTQSKKSWEHTSVANMTFYCDFWLKETDKMLQNVEGDSKEDSRSEFCMNYFGVSKQLRNGCKTVYLLLYPDAAWVHDINPRHIKRNEYSSWIDADQFVSAVKRYWSSKLSTYGIQFLETLEALYKFSVDNALSLYCKTAILIHIFKVSKFLTKSKFVNHREYSDMLQKFLEISIRNFFDHIYLLDLENSITDDMLCFRESDTSRNFQRDVSRMITSRTMTSKETGILITALFSVKFPFSLYKQTLASFKACYTTSWKVFVENFRNIRSEVTGDCNDDTGELALVQKFHKALEDTDFADFSPSCYLFLLDRLLIMVSFLKGYFFTPKFLLVEWLISNGWNVNPNLNFVSGVQQPFLEDIVHFIAGMVKKLLYHEQDTIEWIRKHNLNMDCYPIIVLRLFVILCLLCINFDGFSDFIFNLLEKREITLLLPWKFYESLRRLREHGKTEVKIEVVAEALKNIGNPLVIVNLGIEFSVSDAIFLNLNVEQHRGSIMKALRPGLNRKQSRGRRIFSNINHQGELQTSSFDSVMERNAAETQSEEVSKGQRTNRRFWTMVGSLDYEGIHRNNFQIDVLPLKKIVLEFILLVTNSVIRWCCQCSWQDCEVPYEQFDSLLDELQQLYSTLCLSEFYFEDVKAIQNIVKKLQLRRERIEPFVERWLMCERKLEENTDPESHKNGGAEKCSSEVAVSCTTGQCSSDRSDKEGGDRSADEYSSEL